MHHERLMSKLRSKVIQTESWNPLIFAIYYGNFECVKYICSHTSTQQLYYLLCDPFKADQELDLDIQDNDEKEANDSEFILERSELLSLILCLMTNNTDILEYLWNHPMLWNKHIYLIIFGNFVFETGNPTHIRNFLLSNKTKMLFNSISLCEK